MLSGFRLSEVLHADGYFEFQSSRFHSVIAANTGGGGDAPTGPGEHYDGGDGVVVAIIDSGVDLDHPDLVGNIWENTGEIPGDGIDNDGNGFIDDVNGYDFIDNDGNPDDEYGHGTFIAGVVTAQNTGVADGATVMPVRALDENGNGEAAAVASAIYYAVDNGADIINLSLETIESAAVRYAVQYAADRNVLVVFSSGNDGASEPAWSGTLSGEFETAISVGALELDGERMPTSNNVGNSGAVQVDANGVRTGILPNGEPGVLRGTSVSAATVSAAAALLLAENRRLTASQLRDILLATLKAQALGSDALGTIDIPKAMALATKSAEVRVARDQDRLYINATSTEDEIRIDAAESVVDINGIRYFYPGAETTRLVVNGMDGTNRLTLTGSSGDDFGHIQTGYAQLVMDGFTAAGRNMDFVSLHGLGGDDLISVYDTAGDEEVLIQPGQIRMTVDGGYRAGFGFEDVRAYATSGGTDSVEYTGSSGADRMLGNPFYTRLVNDSFFSQANAFDQVEVDLGDGVDIANLNGNNESDSLLLTPSTADFSGADYDISVTQLERVISNGGQGDDNLQIQDGFGKDTVTSRPNNTLLVGESYDQRGYGFETTRIYSQGGLDEASVFGSNADDSLSGDFNHAVFAGEAYTTHLFGFPSLWANAYGGNDMLDFSGSIADEFGFLSPTVAYLSNTMFEFSAGGFELITLDGGGGNDQVNFVDSASDEVLALYRSEARLSNDEWSALGRGFEIVRATSLDDDGTDVIDWHDDELDYTFAQFGDWV